MAQTVADRVETGGVRQHANSYAEPAESEIKSEIAELDAADDRDWDTAFAASQGTLSRLAERSRAHREAGRTDTETMEDPQQTPPESVVLFTSYDGTVREVGAMPPNLGRATALASVQALHKIWGTPEEEAACDAMQKEI